MFGFSFIVYVFLLLLNECIQDVLFLSLMSIASITVFMLPLFFIFLPIVSSFYIYLFLAFQFIFYIFRLPAPHPHLSSVFFNFFFMVFVHQANCFTECIFILIHDKLSGPERHLIGSIFHLQDSFATLFYISSYRIYQCLLFSTCHHWMSCAFPNQPFTWSSLTGERPGWPSRLYSPLLP